MDGSDSISPGIAPVTGLDITGAWHLADCLLTYANGKTQRPWASSASGYLIYSPNGHMCLSLNYPGRTGNIECISYCGQYEIVADRVFHSIAVSANIRDIGTVLEQTRTTVWCSACRWRRRAVRDRHCNMSGTVRRVRSSQWLQHPVRCPEIALTGSI